MLGINEDELESEIEEKEIYNFVILVGFIEFKLGYELDDEE